MGAARVIQGPATWRRACRAAAVAAALLAAAPAAAHAQQDTVRVEWARSSDEARVILNAYRVRGGKPVLASIRGLLIDRDPVSGPDRLYAFVEPERAYGANESRGFMELLGPFETVLDTLANDGKPSDNPDRFSATEWRRFLEKLLQPGEKVIVEGTHRLIVAQVSEPIRPLIAEDVDALSRGGHPGPLLPHLASGRLAVTGVRDGGRDSIDFGSVELGKRDSATVAVWNYGVRPVETRLRFSGGEGDTAFSSGHIPVLAVRPGETVQVTLAFAPARNGSHRATLDFLVGGEPAARAILTGAGEPPGAFERGLSFLATWWWVIVLLAIGAAWKMGVTLPSPWRRRREELDGRETTRQRDDPPPLTAVHRQLTLASESLQSALALLGKPPGSDGGGESPGRGGNELRRLEELERERGGFVEEQSGLRERVRELEDERVRLDGEVRTLQEERTRLDRQVESLEGVPAENERLRAQVAAADRTADGVRRDLQRVTGERDTLGARLGALARVLELSDEMLSDAGWPETLRRLPALRDGGKPRYLWSFEQLVADLTAIFEEIAPRACEGRLAAAVSAVLAGSNQNAGLRTVAAELEPRALATRLGLGHARELRALPAERFYRDFVDRRFRPVIDNIAKLGLYARSRSPEIGMEKRLSREGVEPALLERALALVEARLRADFGVEVHMVQLFEERFDRSRHDTASHSTLRHTLPDLDASIRRLPPETIYDITSVGLRSDRLGVSVRPVVAWVASR